ncbi:putative amino acid permease [Gymnopus androsaceus JB14]|uniref:Amino acid permease n=1 Tax=Gymnopus androsaceus JB14 TaxID=1447944 RepID=A0A6A4HYL8_9AGAR|nr:putative amino acid permease [Gymnopus androsaceus JB14]
MASNHQQSRSEKKELSDDASASEINDGILLEHLGKKSQLKRIFGFLAMLGFSSTILSSWESICSVLSAGFFNGGPVSLIYGMLLAISGSLALAASLAEMASICPIAGAQYHWTYIFAPRKWANFVTWMQGWITVFAWQAGVTSTAYVTAAEIQGLMIFNYPSYAADPKRWHATLLMWAVMLVCFSVNVFAIKLLPIIEILVGILHLAFFIALLVPLVVLSPRSTSEFVWTELVNESGGYSNGISWCVGLITVAYSFSGFDGAIHMSEEVRHAATAVPKIIVLSVVINAVLAFGFVIGLLYSVGNVQNALNTPTGFPIIEIFYQATGSAKAATAMMAALIIAFFCCTLGMVASVSRLTWAFSRDGGLPFSPFFAYVSPHYNVPVRSICFVVVAVMLLSLINIASTIALDAILSLNILALYLSYLIPIGLLLFKRFRKEQIDFGPFTLGRFGWLINLYAIVYGVFIYIFLPFPPSVPVTGTTMNYGGPVFGGVLLFALGDWVVRGRKQFHGPVREVNDSENKVKDEGMAGAGDSGQLDKL